MDVMSDNISMCDDRWTKWNDEESKEFFKEDREILLESVSNRG